jgi:HK97 family phage major capsid protein
MSSKAKELRQQRAALVAQMNEITTAATGAFTAEQREKWERIEKDQESLRVQIEAVEKSEKLAEEMNSFTKPSQSQPNSGTETRTTRENWQEVRASDEYKSEFRNFLVNGERGRILNEVRTYSPLDNVTGANGEYLIPVGFQKNLETKLKAFGGMRRNAQIITTSAGNTLDWPTVDDTTNVGTWLSVNSAVTQGPNPSFGQVQFTSNLVSSGQILAPVQLLQDSAFDLEAFLTDALAIRIGRATNLAYTTGNGSGQPNGLVNNITNIVTARGDGGTGNTEINSVGTNDLANLISNLDPAYRVNAKFMANQSTWDTVRKLKDTLGRPLWEASLTAGEPDMIFGYRFDWNQNMAAIAASALSVCFGDFSKYVIRDVLGVTMIRYNELYMPNHQIGFQAYARTDGQILQNAAFTVLQHPLS